MTARESLSDDEIHFLRLAGVDATDSGLDDLYHRIVAETSVAIAAHQQMPLHAIALLVGVSDQYLIELLGERSAWDASWIMATPQRRFAADGSDRTPLQYLAQGGDRQEVLEVLTDYWGW